MTADPQSPQWEACTVCGGDHWTKDHPADHKPQTEAGRQFLRENGTVHTRWVLAIEAEAAAALDVEWLARAMQDANVPWVGAPLDDYIRLARLIVTEYER